MLSEEIQSRFDEAYGEMLERLTPEGLLIVQKETGSYIGGGSARLRAYPLSNVIACTVWENFTQHFTGTSCHGNFRCGYEIEETGKPLYMLTMLREEINVSGTKFLSHDDRVEYYDYLMNRSPYKDVFITKSYQEAVDNGYIVASCNHPGNLIIGAMQAARKIWEYTHITKGFLDIRELGYEENIALMLAYTISSGLYRGTSTFNKYFECRGFEHSPLCMETMSKGGANNFRHGVMGNPNEVYTTYQCYDDVYGLWNGGQGDITYLHHFIRNVLPFTRKTDTLDVFSNTKHKALNRGELLNALKVHKNDIMAWLEEKD